MFKNKRNGFFLSETIVIIAIVSVVLLGTFKLFSSVYSKYKEGENYNKISAINATSSLKQYYTSKGFDYAALLNGGYYVELTTMVAYDGPYYEKLKEQLYVDKVYLIDLTKVFNGTNINTFDVSLRKYLKTLKSSTNTAVLLTVINGSEYASISATPDIPILIGNATDEYSVLVPIGGTFTDPGYSNWIGSAPTTSWEPILDTSKAGKYYLTYNFGGYYVKRKVIVGEYTYNFDYTGAVQTFTVPTTGYYLLEVWGAQGGQASSTYIGGYGGYSRGVVSLTKDQQIYIYVGGQGGGGCVSSACAGGFNGGGNAGYTSTDTSNYQSGGGGATHISLTSGVLSAQTTGNILIVAGGGGGGYYHTNGADYSTKGANAGGFQGVNGAVCVYGVAAGGGATQSAGGTAGYRGSAGSFGAGGYGTNSGTTNGGAAGGGGGYYGGGAAGHSGAGGGSGYIGNSLLINSGNITKAMYCNNCTTSSTSTTLTYSTTNVSSAPTSLSAKMGNGYAKISFLG